MQHNGRKQIGLALGGGSVRGLAHLGVLTVLEREGITVDCVAGSSVGSLVGAFYCAGVKIEELWELAATIRWRNFADLTWPEQGFVSFEKMERWLIALLGDLEFSDLPKRFAIVATDVLRGEPVTLKEGRLASAVRASCTVPGIVKPINVNGRLLIDGGVSDNLPVAAVRSLGADYVIGVDICRPWFGRPWGPLAMGFGAVETLVRRAGHGIHAADCLISPDLAGFSYVRFSQSDELIARGKRAAEEKLAVIKADLSFDTQ